MKALGAVHFKGNWTDKKNQNTAFIAPLGTWNWPPALSHR